MVIEQDAGFEGNSGMNITDCQKEVLDTLRCERLSSKENNLREISTFYNTRNSCIVDALLNEAYEEDENGVVAYYLVNVSSI